MKITYYLEVLSSWCYWVEPAWVELRSVQVAAAAVPDVLDAPSLLARARSPDIESRARASTAEFHSLGVTMRPAFLLENASGDKALFSGLASSAPLIVAADALLADEAAQIAYAAHHGPPPST